MAPRQGTPLPAFGTHAMCDADAKQAQAPTNVRDMHLVSYDIHGESLFEMISIYLILLSRQTSAL